MSAQATVQYHVRQGAPQAFEFDVDGVLGRLEDDPIHFRLGKYR